MKPTLFACDASHACAFIAARGPTAIIIAHLKGMAVESLTPQTLASLALNLDSNPTWNSLLSVVAKPVVLCVKSCPVLAGSSLTYHDCP